MRPDSKNRADELRMERKMIDIALKYKKLLRRLE
jgi:hypothetical protein